MNAAPIHSGIHAVSCSCSPVTFSGVWNVTSVNATDTSSFGKCSNKSCKDESTGALASQSLVCVGRVVPLLTYQANLTFIVTSEGCVNVNMSVVPGRVYSHTAISPLSLSFLRTNYYLMGTNPFAVVTNFKGVTVGQIQSDMIHIEYENLSNVSVRMSVTPCLLYDNTIEMSGEYDIFDIGILLSDGETIRPLGLINTLNVTTSTSVKVCFSEVYLDESTTSLILIQRVLHFETASANSNAEESIVLTSAILFCIGAFTVLVFHCFIPFNLAVFTVGVQSFSLLLIRGVYFFLLFESEIVVGGLLDFALVEIPTFIYIGIFLEIILVAYWLFFKSDDVPQYTLFAVVSAALVINWSIFAAIIIILDVSNSSSSFEKGCNCQLSGDVVENNTAKVIRIIYKSIVLAVAVIVTFVTFVYGRKYVKSRNQTVYYEAIGLSLGLLFDFVAFLVYYIVNTPSAYFLVALWFTELLPILFANGMVASTYIKYWIGKGKEYFQGGRGQPRVF